MEDELRTLFPDGYPVLCSSGRAALAMALMHSNASRADLVGVFPYASHCVLDAVSRVATPLSGPTAAMASLRVVYHQWGFVQEKKLPPNSIEDCVDTLCVPGATLFPGGGRFEVWSLPKILGTTSGGVLWCRDAKTADDVRKMRDQHGSGVLPWAVRLLGHLSSQAHLYWQGVEASGGAISRLQTGEILAAIQGWENLIADRMEKMRVVVPLAVDWLSTQKDRLPSVIPLPLRLSESDACAAGISSGYRFFERLDPQGNRSLTRVLPIPIHQDVSRIWLHGIVNAMQ